MTGLHSTNRERGSVRVIGAVATLVLIVTGLVGLSVAAAAAPSGDDAGEARKRWERMAQIRRDKFDLVLPDVMRENGFDMWITVVREGLPDPLFVDFGAGYVGGWGYYVFTDRGGDRIERAALGIESHRLDEGGFDIVGGGIDLREFIAERDPERIGVNMSEHIGAADGLSHTSYLHLVETLGEPWAGRLASAEKLVSDFRSRRVATEIAAFAEAGELSREIAERAFSNEVITPGETTLEDVAWWMTERLHDNGLGTSFGMPSVYVTEAEGIAGRSDEHIIAPGDLLMIDWGVGLMNFHTDMKRIAYVLREGETSAPAGIQNAFDQGVRVRDVIRRTIVPGVTAQEMYDRLHAAIEDAGFEMMAEFNRPTGSDKTEVIIGCHSVGNTGHGIGPSIAWFNPERLTYELRPTNLLSIELFAWTAAPEWGGAKVRIPLEDDALLTEHGIEWLYPVNSRILLIR